MIPNFRLTVRSALPARQTSATDQAALHADRRSQRFWLCDDRRHPASTSKPAPVAYRQAHTDWASRVDNEARFLASLKPDLVLTNVSYLPLAGAAAAGIPALSLCSLNWADLFDHFFGKESWAKPIHAEMLTAYRSAQAFLQVTPGHGHECAEQCSARWPDRCPWHPTRPRPEGRKGHPDRHGRDRPPPCR